MQKRIVRFTGFLLASCLLSFNVAAAAPYKSYEYNAYGKSVEAPHAYIPSEIINGDTLGISAFNEPKDITNDRAGNLYISDSKNNRIVVLNPDLTMKKEISAFSYEGKQETLNLPQSLYVAPDDMIYICDKGNKRIVISNLDGKIKKIIAKPKDPVYPQEIDFLPRDLVVTSSGLIYVIAEGIYQGMVVFDLDGQYKGYYGSNRVTASMELMIDMFWKRIMGKDATSKIANYVPIQYSSVCIDSKDFVYVTSDIESDSSNRVRKLNPLGQNIIAAENNRQLVFGDTEITYRKGEAISTSFVSIEVAEDNYITVLDKKRMRIFQYNQDGDLLTAFGGEGEVTGTFVSPVSLCGAGNRILVLDSYKNNITIFQKTDYGETLHKAVDLYAEGKYNESLQYWQRILKYDHNSILANRGIGKSKYQTGDYEEAMNYFKKCNFTAGYSSALKDYRKQYIRENYLGILAAILFFVILIVVIRKTKLIRRIVQFVKRRKNHAV